jgi:hypothetical protein
MPRRPRSAALLLPALLTAALVLGGTGDHAPGPTSGTAAVVIASDAGLPQPGRSRRTGLPVAVAVVALVGSAALWWRVARGGRW